MATTRIPSVEGGIQPTVLTTTGDIIYASSASNPARLGIGSSAQVLTVSGGIPAWTTASSGGMTLIARTSFSAVASIAFDSVFSSTYFSYLAIIENISAATAGDDLQMQMRYGAVTWAGADYYGSSLSSTYSGGAPVNTVSGGTEMTISAATGGSLVGTGSIYFNRVGQSSQAAMFFGQFQQGQVAANTQMSFGGSNSQAQTYTGFLLKSSSTNITGTVAIYGLAKA